MAVIKTRLRTPPGYEYRRSPWYVVSRCHHPTPTLASPHPLLITLTLALAPSLSLSLILTTLPRNIQVQPYSSPLASGRHMRFTLTLTLTLTLTPA